MLLRYILTYEQVYSLPNNDVLYDVSLLYTGIRTSASGRVRLFSQKSSA